MLNIVIIEDEYNALEVLKTMLVLLNKPIKIIAEFGSVTKGVEYLKNNNNIDLLFLDVELLDGNCFQLLDQIDQRNFQVIFTTAFDKYAIKAIRSEAIDYLMKPIAPTELSTAFDKTEQVIKEKSILANHKDINSDKLYINVGRVDGIVRILISDIITLKSEGAYTIITTNKDNILASKNIKHFEQKLDNKIFIRPHQSFVVNINYISSYSSTEGLTLRNGKLIPVSTRKRSLIRNIIFERGIT